MFIPNDVKSQPDKQNQISSPIRDTPHMGICPLFFSQCRNSRRTGQEQQEQKDNRPGTERDQAMSSRITG
jgi:hypothetical protein